MFNYIGNFQSAIAALKSEQRHRVTDLERKAGQFPHVLWNSPSGKQVNDGPVLRRERLDLFSAVPVSPNAYCAPLVENKMRASANVIHPRSSGGNTDKERASVASVVPSSFKPDSTANAIEQ